MSRIAPLQPPYTEEAATLLAAMMPPGRPPIALFRLFARNLPMTRAMHAWGRYELGRDLTLPMRHREIVIARSCARCRCEYEWSVHAQTFGARVGLTPDQQRSLVHGTHTDPCWQDETERLLIEAADALHDTSDIPDDLWNRLTKLLDEPQQIDLILLCGWYHAISFIARATRLPREPGAPHFPEAYGPQPTHEP